MTKRRDIETKYMEERDEIFRALENLNRRDFLKVSAAAVGAAAAHGVLAPHSFSLVNVAGAQEQQQQQQQQPPQQQQQQQQQQATEEPAPTEPWRFAYISDSHLYAPRINDRFLRQLMRAVEDINRLDPQPDFVLYGGDLAQLGQPAELDIGAQILRSLRAPVRMMVGEHDWYLDMGEKWRDLFGEDKYSFDHKGVHFVVLNSVVEADFWTQRGLTPMERMQTVAGLDNQRQSPFTVGEEQRAWLEANLAQVNPATPLVVFSHSPLYKLYRNWNFWTDDADEVQAILRRFRKVTVIHGHTHQLLTNRIGNIHFHGMLSTAWPWPYAPEGMPALTIRMNRSNPFDASDGLGDGTVRMHPDGLADKIYDLWNRNPITVTRQYMTSNGTQDRARRPNLETY